MDARSYNAMMSPLVERDMHRETLRLWEEMQKNKVAPDNATYYNLLRHYSSSNERRSMYTIISEMRKKKIKVKNFEFFRKEFYQRKFIGFRMKIQFSGSAAKTRLTVLVHAALPHTSMFQLQNVLKQNKDTLCYNPIF